MNTLKVGDRVRVISCYDSDCIGKEGFVAFINKPECYISVRFRHNDTIRKIKISDCGCTGIGGKIATLEPIPPTPSWLPIDKDNLPSVAVLCGNKLDLSKSLVGYLFSDSAGNVYLKSLGVDGRVENITHYIPLSDLLNLPIAE